MIWTIRHRFLIVFGMAILGYFSTFGFKAQAQAAGQAASANRLPDRTTILKGASARPLFKQCSRPSPAAASFWTPTVADVRAAEHALPPNLQSLKLRPPKRSLGSDYRQYVGFVSKVGHKCLYVNACEPRVINDMTRYTPPGRKPFDWKREPMSPCDGGNSFWGAEYDVQTGRWSRFYFNGHV